MNTAQNSLLRSSFKAGAVALALYILAASSLAWLQGTPQPSLIAFETENDETRISSFQIASMKTGKFETCMWPYGYGIRATGDKVELILRIKFIYDGNLKYDAGNIAAYEKRVKGGVQQIWNNKFRVKNVITGETLPLVLTIRSDGMADKYVHVHRGSGPTNMRDWFLSDDGPKSQAHEVGHMIGLFDEYKEGAVSRSGFLAKDGLMCTADGKMYPRYYDAWLSFMGHEWVVVEEPKDGGANRNKTQQIRSGKNVGSPKEKLAAPDQKNGSNGRSVRQGRGRF